MKYGYKIGIYDDFFAQESLIEIPHSAHIDCSTNVMRYYKITEIRTNSYKMRDYIEYEYYKAECGNYLTDNEKNIIMNHVVVGRLTHIPDRVISENIRYDFMHMKKVKKTYTYIFECIEQ